MSRFVFLRTNEETVFNLSPLFNLFKSGGFSRHIVMTDKEEVNRLRGKTVESSFLLVGGTNIFSLEYSSLGSWVFLCNGFPLFNGELGAENFAKGLMKDVVRGGRFLGLRKFLRHVTGEFSFVFTDKETFIVSRSILGGKPLFYVSKPGLIAFASERKLLWALSMEEVNRFPPGWSLLVKGNKCEWLKTNGLAVFRSEKGIDESAETIVNRLYNILEVIKTATGSGKVFLGFSGGLDSSIIAKTALDIGLMVKPLTIGVKGAYDVEKAVKAASLLDIDVIVKEITLEKVKDRLKEIFLSMEHVDPLNLLVGTPVFFLAKTVSEMGGRIILLGGGADEMFGGYRKYVEAYVSGLDVNQIMERDIVENWKRNVERDYLICSWNGLDAEFPFLDKELTELALGMGLNQKLLVKGSGVIERKAVLRRVAGKLGLPPEIIKANKKAIQYGSGVSKLLKEVAREYGLGLLQRKAGVKPLEALCKIFDPIRILQMQMYSRT